VKFIVIAYVREGETGTSMIGYVETGKDGGRA
jgi:hypothetical protein